MYLLGGFDGRRRGHDHEHTVTQNCGNNEERE
jgi:hypothetical protein